MNVRANLLLAALFLGFVALGAYQGARVEELTTADRLHGWVVSAATQLRLGGSLEPAVAQASADQEPPDYRDVEFFEEGAASSGTQRRT